MTVNPVTQQIILLVVGVGAVVLGGSLLLSRVAGRPPFIVPLLKSGGAGATACLQASATVIGIFLVSWLWPSNVQTNGWLFLAIVLLVGLVGFFYLIRRLRPANRSSTAQVGHHSRVLVNAAGFASLPAIIWVGNLPWLTLVVVVSVLAWMAIAETRGHSG